MARNFIANQVFIGLPWKNVRKKYDEIVPELEKKYPLHFSIVGRNDGQDAKDLFEIIKTRISSSSSAIFDATDGNANVSLEYGYAEGIEVPRYIFLSTHGRVRKNAASPIISDLSGMRRVQYKIDKQLQEALTKFCKEHDYCKRYEKALAKVVLKGKSKGQKRSTRSLCLKIIRTLDGHSKRRRADIAQHLKAEGYTASEVEDTIKKLHKVGLINCSTGKFSDVTIT